MDLIVVLLLAVGVKTQPRGAEFAPSHRGTMLSAGATEARRTDNAVIGLLELECAMHVTKFTSLQINQGREFQKIPFSGAP